MQANERVLGPTGNNLHIQPFDVHQSLVDNKRITHSDGIRNIYPPLETISTNEDQSVFGLYTPISKFHLTLAPTANMGHLAKKPPRIGMFLQAIANFESRMHPTHFISLPDRRRNHILSLGTTYIRAVLP